MKYTKLFNNHSEYAAYTGGTNFVTPNVSWCIEDEEAHCTPLIFVMPPTITCDGKHITIACVTSEATIYYRLNKSGEYSAYTEAISIMSDTIVEAYSELDGVSSDIVEQECHYSNVTTPSIYCDGEYVTINCETPSVDLYYRFNESGSYSAYTEAIVLTASTIVEAYAELDSVISNTAKQNCIYIAPPNTPTITSDGEHITIACNTVGATVYYRLDESGEYTAYTTTLIITADTVVEAYSEKDGRRSEVISETCTYGHNYALDYLTFRVLSGGTIIWKAFDTSAIRTISASTDNGVTWTEYTSTTGGTAINVVTGDKVLIKGENNSYATGKDKNSRFTSGGTAYYNVEGNIMSLVSGDNFTQATGFTSTYVFHGLFGNSKVVSAKNLILPVMTLTESCYRALFSKALYLEEAPELPATTLAASAYTYMFDVTLITKSPELPAAIVPTFCYRGMFDKCYNLNYIKCLATNVTASNCTSGWTTSVAANGTFIKASSMNNWSRGSNGIPKGWTVVDDGQTIVEAPTISCDGEHVTITCATTNATIYYRLNETGEYTAYTTSIAITADTIVQAYAEKNGQTSTTVRQYCEYISNVPFEASNRSLSTWTYNNANITTPYSVNAIDGHSSSYAKGTFNFETNVTLTSQQPTYLWFQHADQSASIYVDDTLVTKHWGGYSPFFADISNYVHSGSNSIKVMLSNNEGNNLAPCAGDFNFNATLGNVKLFTSPYIPSMEYGYDGFHVTSSFEYSDTARTTASAATISVKTSVPTGATVICTINSGDTNIYSASSASTGEEMIFTTPSLTGANLHLWDGTIDPFLYNITLEIYHGQDLYHKYERGYGLRYYEYLINDTERYGTVQNPFTGFKLNGHDYLLRGVCLHDDLADKANALNDNDYTQEFNIIRELNCNFLRLAHYPHPKEVYDLCDQYGLIVQTEVPWVNQSNSSQPEAYYTHLEGQYDDMVKQHYNHPCILFWGLANEIKPATTAFTKAKIEQYAAQIKALDSERLIGFVMSHSYNSPTSFGTPNVDWFGCNIYVGWYVDKTSNNPTNQLNTRKTNFITNANKPFAFSEYGCGGTQRCHSDNPQETTTKGTNQPRHDIEYQMWLHEGHIAAIRNFPQLLFTAQWQLFDIAVYNRQEGYITCLDGETTSTDDNLKFLNNKGLVERDHVTKKDTFYLYKAEWNQNDKFVHICGKDYTKKIDREIKCYTNDGNTLTMYVNNVSVDTASVTNHIAVFSSRTFNEGDVVKVGGSTVNDSFIF